MAKKPKVSYRCTACGTDTPRWVGQCPTCKEWNTLEESGQDKPKRARTTEARVKRIGDVELNADARLPTGVSEFDRTMGGGIVPGSVTLLGGDPGVGKSTLLLQILAALAKKKKKVLYVTGEESAAQVSMRAHRLDLPGVLDVSLLATIDVDAAFRALRETKAEVCVIDSAQTIRDGSISSSAGSVSQLREVTSKLVDFAKAEGVALFIVGHVTKDGALAGPKVLEHLVDTVLNFEGERGHMFRLLRTTKNRFGATHEVGVFEMVEEGLREVTDPSAFFLSERAENPAPGSVVVPTAEGSRPLLVEVQALVSAPAYGTPRRVVSGLDSNRLAILLAVLERCGGHHVVDRDVFASVAGGAKPDERALDLGLVLAVMSSFRGTPLPANVAVFGELGLAGEVRAVPRAAQRLGEAEKMGFEKVILPARNITKLRNKKLGKLAIGVRTVNEAIDAVFE